MITNKILRNISIILILLINIGCDQVSKNIVRHNIEYNQKMVVIENIVTITKVENTGAFLSLGRNLTGIIHKLLLIFLPFLVLCIALYYLLKNNSLTRSLSLGICLIVGGGYGNLIDRAMYGSVTDFLYFNFGIFHTGIVNIADISIMAGFVILLIEGFQTNEKILLS